MRLHRLGPPDHAGATSQLRRAALKQRLLRRPQSTAENHSPPWQGPAKALRTGPPPCPRPLHVEVSRHVPPPPSPPPQSSGPSQGPAANLRTTGNRRWSVLPPCWASLPTPSEGMLSTRKEGREGSRGRSPMPLQTQAQKGDRRLSPRGRPSELCLPQPPPESPSTCMPPLRPHSAFLSPHSPPLRLSPPPESPPRRPSNASLMGPHPESQLQAWALGSISLLEMGLQSAVPQCWS